MNITLSDEARKQSIASIKRYFAEELDQDIGELKAGLMLDFFLKEIAPTGVQRGDCRRAGVSQGPTRAGACETATPVASYAFAVTRMPRFCIS